MKLLLTFLLVAWIAQTTQSQHIIRVHALSQEIISGVAPGPNDGAGFAPKKRYEYQVFIECKPSVTLRLNSMRVADRIYAARLETVESPVVQFHPTTLQSDTLIPRTTNTLLKVVLGKELARSRVDPLGVSFSYFVRGKKYVQRVRQFKELPPIALP